MKYGSTLDLDARLDAIDAPLGLTTYGQETSEAITVNGTTWVDLLDKTTLTALTEIWSIKVTRGGSWSGKVQLRIIDASTGTKIFPFGDQGVEDTDFINATEWDFPDKVNVPATHGYKVQFRSSSASDGTGKTLTLTELAKIERS